MKKNRIIAFAMVCVMCVAVLAGCGNEADNQGTGVPEANAGEEKMRIVCTTFPQYDWMREIIGEQSEEIELTLLLDDGVDLHSYQPTAEDIAKVASADLFVYVGGESDAWVADAMQEATNPDMKVINLMDTMQDAVKEEEVVEGMQDEDDHEHAEEADENAEETDEHVEEVGEDADDHDDEMEYDEHVWLSVKNAMRLTETLSQAVQELDADHADIYQANTEAYLAQLAELDAEYEETVGAGTKSTILFGDRFPFRYLVDDYGLDYYAAFVGCSAETEASFETITFLAEKIDELDLHAILALESSDQKIADTIKASTKDKDQEILVMNSLQNITASDVSDGVTYVKVMENNRAVLSEALH